MKRRRHTPEQIIRKLREAERMLAEGQTIPAVAKALEVSGQTFTAGRARWAHSRNGTAPTMPRAPYPQILCPAAARTSA